MCRSDGRVLGTTTVTLSRGPSTIVFRAVPADVCEDCGEAFLRGTIFKELEQLAEAAIAAGVRHEVRDYQAAA